jgi:alkylation response protein AidB-like acyl-CoA dehydrogenase
MAEQGLFGIMLPEEDGGQGGTVFDAVLAMEQIALACPRSADVLQAGNFGAFRTLAEYASPAQKERFFQPLLAGTAVAAVGMSEPEAGSALTDLSTHCTPDGDGWRLNGQKVFTTNSAEASVFVVYCRFGPGVGRHWLGAGGAWAGRLSPRPTQPLHERRGVVRPLLRRRAHLTRNGAARPRRLQEANRRLQRRARR